MEVPKLFVWLDLFLEVSYKGIFLNIEVKIGLLFVNMDHFLSKSLQPLVDRFDFGDVVFRFLDLGVILELAHVVLNVFQFFHESVNLGGKTVLNLAPLTPELLLTGLYDSHDLIDPNKGLDHWFHLVLLDLESWVVVKKHEPGNKVMILIHESLLF